MRKLILYTCAALFLLIWEISCTSNPPASDGNPVIPDEPPVVYTDYGLSIFNSTTQNLSDVTINGTNMGAHGIWGNTWLVHTLDLTARITYSVDFCDFGGCWKEWKLCTVPLNTLEYRNYSIDVYDLGRGCKIKDSIFNQNKVNVSGTVVDLIDPTSYADYGITISNSTTQSLVSLTVNGINSSAIHTQDKTLSIAYSVSFSSLYGYYWLEPKLCTISLSSIPYGNYIIDIFNLGRECKLSYSKYNQFVPEALGVVTGTDTDYSIKVYNSTVFTLANLTVNGTNLGKFKPLFTTGIASTLSSQIDLTYQLETCVSIYCTYINKTCSASLTGFPYATYFVHIYNNGDTCAIK